MTAVYSTRALGRVAVSAAYSCRQATGPLLPRPAQPWCLAPTTHSLQRPVSRSSAAANATCLRTQWQRHRSSRAPDGCHDAGSGNNADVSNADYDEWVDDDGTGSGGWDELELEDHDQSHAHAHTRDVEARTSSSSAWSPIDVPEGRSERKKRRVQKAQGTLICAPPHPTALAKELLLKECHLKHTRRGGPGGQHRNKVRQDWCRAKCLPPATCCA